MFLINDSLGGATIEQINKFKKETFDEDYVFDLNEYKIMKNLDALDENIEIVKIFK